MSENEPGTGPEPDLLRERVRHVELDGPPRPAEPDSLPAPAPVPDLPPVAPAEQRDEVSFRGLARALMPVGAFIVLIFFGPLLIRLAVLLIRVMILEPWIPFLLLMAAAVLIYRQRKARR